MVRSFTTAFVYLSLLKVVNLVFQFSAALLIIAASWSEVAVSLSHRLSDCEILTVLHVEPEK